MASLTRRLIAALLLASYGLISACGSGLHSLVDGAHHEAEAHAPHDGGDHPDAPGPSSSDHGDCLICHVVNQGQILAPADPTPSGTLSIGEAPASSPVVDHAPVRLPGDPRAPPSSLV